MKQDFKSYMQDVLLTYKLTHEGSFLEDIINELISNSTSPEFRGGSPSSSLNSELGFEIINKKSIFIHVYVEFGHVLILILEPNKIKEKLTTIWKHFRYPETVKMFGKNRKMLNKVLKKFPGVSKENGVSSTLIHDIIEQIKELENKDVRKDTLQQIQWKINSAKQSDGQTPIDKMSIIFKIPAYCFCRKGCKNDYCPCVKSGRKCSDDCHKIEICKNKISNQENRSMSGKSDAQQENGWCNIL